jgi:hypothetical protein
MICVFCKEPIKSGRSDKKFCDAGCKDAYNNEIKIKEHKEITKIETILRKNRRILKKMYSPQKFDKLFSRESLIKAGFEFGFHTHTIITKSKNNEIIFCFDFGYREMTKDNFQLFPSFKKVQVKNGQVFEM